MTASPPSRKLTVDTGARSWPGFPAPLAGGSPCLLRFLGLDLIVRVHAHHPPQGGFALCLHVTGVGHDLQKRLCGILHTPDDDRTDIDRVTDSIIDLERANSPASPDGARLFSWN